MSLVTDILDRWLINRIINLTFKQSRRCWCFSECSYRVKVSTTIFFEMYNPGLLSFRYRTIYIASISSNIQTTVCSASIINTACIISTCMCFFYKFRIYLYILSTSACCTGSYSRWCWNRFWNSYIIEMFPIWIMFILYTI